MVLVPASPLSAENLPPAAFLFAETLTGSTPLHAYCDIKKRSHPKGWLRFLERTDNFDTSCTH